MSNSTFFNTVGLKIAKLSEKFILDVLLKYNSFETLNGFYRQKDGVSMGGKLSGAISSIFVNMLEEKVIKKYKKDKKVLLYLRYVDDCILIVKRGFKGKILKEFNEFDKGLKWTCDNMDNNNLIYLDTKIILENFTLNLYQYRKPNSSENFTNFKTGVSPKAYKLGLISGEVHRAFNCTTTDIALDEALLNLENILVKNAYPRKIVKQKIKEIRDRKQKIKRISEL